MPQQNTVDSSPIESTTGPIPPGLTNAQQATLNALRRYPNATATQVAEYAEIGRSTATRCLTELEQHGLATRIHGGRVDGRRTPDHWHSTESASPMTDAATQSTEPDPADQPIHAPATHPIEHDAPKPEADGRLERGQLRSLVAECLRQRPGVALTTTEISHLLKGRSPGAIANALDKLMAEGTVVQITSRPRRCQIVHH